MNPYKILVVDDDYASRLMVQKALQQHGYNVSLAANGEEALKLLKEDHYHLVITDLIMEGLSGIELLGKVKEVSSDTATILLTGHASLETAIEAVRLGATDYLSKPINLEELNIRVKRAFERLELEHRLYEAERKLTYHATIATANHEINQPLTVIISAIDMLRMELKNLNIQQDKIFKYLELMQNSSMRIANILRKLREVTSPKIQDVPLGMKMVEIHDETSREATSPKEYILIIEDEENLRQILQEILEAEKYKVILAQTAREGIDLYEAHHDFVELVILDFNLPDADGLEVLKKLKSISPQVKVLLTSGFDVESSIPQAAKFGAVDFIRKPFNREQILEVVKKIYSLRSHHTQS
ncbi:MAG: response regulator [Calditrichaeota bacterium]|nr:MAG: response regulator [Calditrichota bacterium]